MGFTHLHVHTEYSLLDGAARIKKLVARAKELGMSSLAITDHGAMFGVIDFYKECKENGIKPIIGCEVYTAARTLTDKSPDMDKRQGHLILLAKDQTGYKNLIKLVSLGYRSGFYYKPRIDKDALRRYSQGILGLSACLAGDVQSALLKGDYAGAREEALTFLEIFGEGNFYLEVQDQGLEEEIRIFPMMRELALETGIPLVATNDVHYVNREDANFHDVLLCIQTGSKVGDEHRMRFANDQFYLKSEEEMRNIFSVVPEACDNTQVIAEKCNVEFEFGKLHLPEYDAPQGMRKEDFLKKLCMEGLEARYKDTSANERRKLEERLEYELETIEGMGYVEYFLIVWDFIRYANEKNIMVGPGRGSAAGSLVAFVLRITNIDPIKYNLIFERFLNPERISMPDIDIDFCYERREEVIDYVIEKYGEDKVAQIITFGTMKAKQAVRDVGRALDVPYGEVDVIAKAIPNELKMDIDRALKVNPELRKMYESNQKVKHILDTAREIEGMPRHASTHAAGVVISKDRIDDYVPLYFSDKGISTQFTMTTIEELGLLKMDFLGLRNLTVIREALDLIEENRGIKLDIDGLPFDDPKVYEMISSGNTQGVFQLESSGMTTFMQNLKPDCFEDIVAGISLYRPGPMASIPTYIENKKNTENIEYLHESLKPILSVTYGCMVYQEQVMQIVRDVAGYTYGRSDLLRRAMSKKKMDVMLAEKEIFIEGAEKTGLTRRVSEEIFNQMVSFAEYAFNKSHAAAYGVIGYQTAYLKTYYPREFMAALISSVLNDSKQVSRYIRNCKEMGIQVLPPDVNMSAKKFSVDGDSIRFGLLGVKNVGGGVIDGIIEARERFGPAKNIFDFINRLAIQKVNKKAVESLIRSGAMDSMEGNRAQNLAMYESVIESAQNMSRKNVEGQISLFTDMSGGDGPISNADLGEELPQLGEFSKEVLSTMEKEVLGVYITDHPLNSYEAQIKAQATMTTDQLNSQEEMDSGKFRDGDVVVIGGIVSGRKNLITKANKTMAFLTVEDFFGEIEVVVFANVYERYLELINEDSVVLIKGRLDFKEDEAPKILAESILDAKLISADVPVKIRIPSKEKQNNILDRVQEIIAEHGGGTKVNIYLPDGRCIAAKEDMWVTKSVELEDSLKELLGSENVKM